MDTTIRIFSRQPISKRKYRYPHRIFHANTNTMHRLVPSVYKNGKRKPKLKFINTSNQPNTTDHTTTNLPNNILLNQQHNKPHKHNLRTINSNNNPIYTSTSNKTNPKRKQKQKTNKILIQIPNTILSTSYFRNIQQSRTNTIR